MPDSDGWSVDFPIAIGAQNVPYRARRLSTTTIFVEGPPLRAGFIEKARVPVAGALVELMVNVKVSGDGTSQLVPFGLGGEAKAGWFQLLSLTRA